MKTLRYRLDSCERILRQLALVSLWLVCTGPAESQTTMAKYAGNPVMQPGPAGSWDDGGIFPGPVVYQDSVFHLWYIGWDGTNDWSYYRTGYACSNDGVHWTKCPRPVIDVGSSGAWDALDAEAGGVLYDGIRIKAWYSGYSNSGYNMQIGYATGINETTWTRRPDPVLTAGPSGSWDKAAVMWPFVRSAAPGSFEMWYTGWDGSKLADGTMRNNQIGYATASSETTWTKYALNPVLIVGSAGQWDDARIWLPMVVFDPQTLLFHMFYSGKNASTGKLNIGYAKSSDGMNWTKHNGNPVLTPGPHESWDQNGIILGGVVMVRDTFRLWYTGYDALWTGRIGYATSPKIIDDIEDEHSKLPSAFSLGQNYPNPFNPTTAVGYQLPVASLVNLTVYDLLGREVRVLVNERKGPGSYTVGFDAGDFPSGVYLYRLTAGDFVQTRTMLLLK